jgi:hypothetical protein
MTTPGLGRVIIGALLNAIHQAEGELAGRVLFLLDEVARLGRMKVLEAARDVGRKLASPCSCSTNPPPSSRSSGDARANAPGTTASPGAVMQPCRTSTPH